MRATVLAMNEIKKTYQQIELNRLNLRLSNLRQHPTLAYLRMADSIERDVQLIPIIAIPEDEQRWLLIDGYLRIRALQKIGADTVKAEIWSCDTGSALLQLLAERQQKQWRAIEQGELDAMRVGSIVAYIYYRTFLN